MEHGDRHEQDRKFLEQVRWSAHGFLHIFRGQIFPIVGGHSSVVEGLYILDSFSRQVHVCGYRISCDVLFINHAEHCFYVCIAICGQDPQMS